MNQSSPICVLYLCDASNNEENGRMKRENSDDHKLFFYSTKFFLPSQRQKSITSATITFFINKDKETSFTQKLKNCYLVKGHVSVNFNQASIKALRLPPYHSAIPQSKEHCFNPSSILITINMTHLFLFKFKSMI